MPIPDFIVELRRHVGIRPLPLVGVTAVVERDGKVLLGRRSDTGALTPITGIVDPAEEPADAAVRETLEEAGVRVRAVRLAQVGTIPRIVFDNGDQADFLDLTFRCEWLEGDPYPADGEMTEVGWYDLGSIDALVAPDMRARITAALADEVAARFSGGR